MFHVELQSWLTQSIELTCSRTFRCLNMCHALCFLVYVDSTDLVSQTLPVCLSRPARRRRASTGASTFLDRISLVADRTRVRTVQRQYCVSLFVWKCEVAARRCPVAGGPVARCAARVRVCRRRVSS